MHEGERGDDEAEEHNSGEEAEVDVHSGRIRGKVDAEIHLKEEADSGGYAHAHPRTWGQNQEEEVGRRKEAVAHNGPHGRIVQKGKYYDVGLHLGDPGH